MKQAAAEWTEALAVCARTEALYSTSDAAARAYGPRRMGSVMADGKCIGRTNANPPDPVVTARKQLVVARDALMDRIMDRNRQRRGDCYTTLEWRPGGGRGKMRTE